MIRFAMSALLVSLLCVAPPASAGRFANGGQLPVGGNEQSHLRYVEDAHAKAEKALRNLKRLMSEIDDHNHPDLVAALERLKRRVARLEQLMEQFQIERAEDRALLERCDAAIRNVRKRIRELEQNELGWQIEIGGGANAHPSIPQIANGFSPYGALRTGLYFQNHRGGARFNGHIGFNSSIIGEEKLGTTGGGEVTGYFRLGGGDMPIRLGVSLGLDYRQFDAFPEASAYEVVGKVGPFFAVNLWTNWRTGHFVALVIEPTLEAGVLGVAPQFDAVGKGSYPLLTGGIWVGVEIGIPIFHRDLTRRQANRRHRPPGPPPAPPPPIERRSAR